MNEETAGGFFYNKEDFENRLFNDQLSIASFSEEEAPLRRFLIFSSFLHTLNSSSPFHITDRIIYEETRI